jgi:hypothetical protein
MPFRKLPNTDDGRLQALGGAAKKAAAVSAAELAFTAPTKAKLDVTYPKWKQEVEERGQALAAQSDATSKTREQGNRLRMYVSHFFQSLNFAIQRGVFAESDRAHYQLDVSQTTLPPMDAEADLILWAGRTVSGEASRTAAGGLAMPFPAAAEVQAELTKYEQLHDQQSAKSDAYDDEQKDVEDMRDEVDGLIRDIWDEVEFTFRHETPPSLRRKARQYAVVYATRPGEAPEVDDAEPPVAA